MIQFHPVAILASAAVRVSPCTAVPTSEFGAPVFAQALWKNPSTKKSEAGSQDVLDAMKKSKERVRTDLKVCRNWHLGRNAYFEFSLATEDFKCERG